MTFRDITFCCSPVHKPGCEYPWTPELAEEAKRWWGKRKGHPPVSFAYFCGGQPLEPPDTDIHPTRENPLPGPFTRRVVKRTENEDGTQDVTLECGHLQTYIIPMQPEQKYSPCSQCADDYLKAHVDTTRNV